MTDQVLPPTTMIKSTNLHGSLPRNAMHVASLLALLFLSACISKVDQLPKEVKVDVPTTWQNTQEQPPSQEDTVPEKNETDAVKNGWLDSFEDNELSQYVETALANNPDLLGSAANLKIAIEQVTITGSNLWPSLQGTLSNNRTTIDGAGISERNALSNGAGITTETRTVSATLDVSWEADIWGKLTQRKKAAVYSAQAQGELFKAAELSLVGNVSRAWYNLITNKLQLDLAQQRLDSFKRTTTLIEENYERGLRSALDVYLSRSDVQVQISSLSNAQFDYIQSLRAFKTLLGEYPSNNLEFNANLPELTNTVPTGLPAELLTRRPDVRASQLRYKSQIALAKAAYRDRFPSISFRGSIGDSREEFNQLFDNDNMIMTLASNLTQPIFASGALKSAEDQALYQAESSYAELVQTTLRAFEEVENSLSRETLLLEQHNAIKKAVTFAQGGLELALERYQSGIENYTTVLEAQRRLFDSMRTEINIRNAILQNRIGIHLALGGDFSNIEGRNPLNNLPGIGNQDDK